MKKTVINAIIPLFLLMVLLGCNSYSHIYSTTEPSADFKKYKKFAWLKDKADTANTPYNNEIIRNNIRNYFSKEMSDRGMIVDVETPDLLLELAVKNVPHRVRETFNDAYYYGHRYYYRSRYYSPYGINYYYVWHPQYAYGYPTNYRTVEQTHMDNTVTLNVIDAKEKKLVWTGTVEADIYDPSVIEKDIHPAITKLMEHYPIQPTIKTYAYGK